MSEVVLEMCDPRERERELKDLFARNGKPEFATVFDRAYRLRAQQGQRCCVALLGSDVVMHVSVTPVPLVRGNESFTVGVMSDLMADDGYRDFWAPVKLLRKLTSELKKTGDIDFLLSTTTPEAESVFKATGFKPFGTLRRYVLPLNPLYLAFARLRSGVKRTKTQSSSYDQFAQAQFPLPEVVRPAATAEFYASRIPRMEFVDGNWLSVLNGRKSNEAFALMARDPYMNDLRLADAFWNDAGLGIGEVLHAAARWGRRQGFKKFALGTLHESRFAQELQRCGFFPRDVRSQLLVNQLSPRTAPKPDDWFLLGFALSGW